MPSSQVLNCPSCRTPMEKKSFPRKLSGAIELDLCFACRGIWFDKYENLQIESAGVIELFSLINEHRNDQRLPLAAKLLCPRCGDPMKTSMNLAKSGAFNYLRCRRPHGHFIVFAQFMIEKGFVRQLTGAEIDQLKEGIGVIRCTGCGAPVDIRKDSACRYCYAPIALLDPTAVEVALTNYQKDALKKAAPPDPQLMADAILAKHCDNRVTKPDVNVYSDIGDLLIEGVALAWRFLRKD